MTIWVSKAINSLYFKNTFKVITGTTIAQIINFLFNIYLTRIYLPESFGKFSLFMSILSVILIFSCFKLDISLVKSASQDEIKNNFLTAYKINFLISGISVFIIFCLWMFNFFNLSEYNIWWVIIFPLIVFLQTSIQIMWMFSLKLKLFSLQTIYKIIEALGINVLYVALSSFQDMGLLLANFFVLIAMNVFLWKKLSDNIAVIFEVKTLFAIKIKKLLSIFKNQKYYMLQSLLEVLQMSLIPFYFSNDLKLIGYYALCMRVIQVPVRFLGLPISQSFFSEIADRKIRGLDMHSFFIKVFLGLLVIGLTILVVVMLWGPLLFKFIFGEDWMYSGILSQIFILWIIADFIKGPMMQALYLFEKQKFVFNILLISVIVMFIPLQIKDVFGLNNLLVFWFISISQTFFISVLVYKAYLSVKQYKVQ